MASFSISTVAGRVLAELPLDGAALDGLVTGDLLRRLPPRDIEGGAPRLLLGPRELRWAERLADLALAPGAVVTLVLVPDPAKAAADLMGVGGSPVRLAAARALRAMGTAAAGQAEELADTVLSDPDAEVVDVALQALGAIGSALMVPQDVGAAVAPSSARVVFHLEAIAQLAQDLEDPRQRYWDLSFRRHLVDRLEALWQLCDGSPEQAALRGQTVMRRLAPMLPDGDAARQEPRLAGAACLSDPLPAGPFDDPRPEVRLAAVAVLEGRWRDPQQDGDIISRLCGVLQGDACPDVRRRAAVVLERASSRVPAQGPMAAGLQLAREALAAQMAERRQRMEAAQSLQQLIR